MTQDVYDEESDQVITVATDFAYGDDVAPIVIPSEYTSLTE